jgi:hypothetical protein
MRTNWDALQPIPADLTVSQRADIAEARDEMCQAFAAAIVPEITGNAVVTATGADPQGGTVTSTGTVS